MLRSVLALLIAAHGVGHILFLVPLLGLANWGQASRSWLLTAETPARLIGSLLWITVIIAFGAAVFGLLGQQGWWRTAAIAAAVISSAGLILFWVLRSDPQRSLPSCSTSSCWARWWCFTGRAWTPWGHERTSMGVLKRTDSVAFAPQPLAAKELLAPGCAAADRSAFVDAAAVAEPYREYASSYAGPIAATAGRCRRAGTVLVAAYAGSAVPGGGRDQPDRAAGFGTVSPAWRPEAIL